MEILRRASVSNVILFPLLDGDDANRFASPALSTGDVKLHRVDEDNPSGVVANATNLPQLIGGEGGLAFQLTLTADECSPGLLLVTVIDQTDPPAFADQAVAIQFYGDAGGMDLIAVDLADSTNAGLSDLADVVEAVQDIYMADIQLTIDGSSRDEYDVVWFKNGVPLTSGITSPTINVVRRSDGEDHIATTAMTAVTDNWFTYNASTPRIDMGEAYNVVAAAVIDGSLRTWSRLHRRDNS